MKEPLNFLTQYRAQLSDWIENPTTNAPHDAVFKLQAAVDLSIELIQSDRKVLESEKHFFEGGAYLLRFFEGWGDEYMDKYSKMVSYIKENHF